MTGPPKPSLPAPKTAEGECEHWYAGYQVNPRTGYRIDAENAARLGAFGWAIGLFCMHCGAAKPKG